jgi:predicted Zn-dependent protease
VDWVGRFWDGGGQPEQVTVRVEGQTVEIVRPSGEVVHWAVAEVKRGDTGVAGMGIRLEFEGKLLIVRDESIAGALGWKADRHPAYGIAGLIGIGVLILLLLVYAVWQWGLPLLGQSLSWRVPVQWEQELGKTVVEQYRSRAVPCPEMQKATETIVRKLAPSSEYEFDVQVVDDPMVNALAAPGGYLVVFRGLVERTSSPEELAVVLAHEITHVVNRHTTGAIFRSAALWAILAVVTGDPTGLATQVAGSLGQLHFQRQQEEDADEGARELLTRARIRPQAMAAVFRKLDQAGGVELVYLSTHPPLAGRIERAERWAGAAKYPVENLQVAGNWPPRASCL